MTIGNLDRRRKFMADGPDPYHTALRFPRELYSRLIDAADRDRRPFNSQAILALQYGLDVLERRHHQAEQEAR
jgi:hypothetical protein